MNQTDTAHTETIPDDRDRDELGLKYRDHEYGRILYFSRLGSVLAFILIPIFIFLDLIVFKAPIQYTYFRMCPLVLALAILMCLPTPLSHVRVFMKFLYLAFLFSLMLMMSGIVAVSAGSSYYEGTMLGLLIVIFAVFLGYRGSMAALLVIILVPITVPTIYMALDPGITPVHVVFMVMPFAETFIVVIIAINQQKMRRKQFLQREVIEYQNRELQKNNRLIEEKNAQMSSDLRLARTIQNNLIPLDLPCIKGVELQSAYLPVEELGGDMYDFIQFNGQSRVGIFISDVSGHGVPAALISAMVKTLVLNAGNEKNECGGFLAYLNNRLIDLAYNNFVTALYGIYDPATRVLRFARAGHPYPCLIEAAGGVRELRSNGRFLGVMPENQCEESSITLHPGDKILFFTDGLVDAENARGEIFETTLLGDILSRMKDVTAETMISTIIENLFQFCEGGRINDDICMVVMEVSR